MSTGFATSTRRDAPTSKFLDLRALAALEQKRFTTRQRIEGAYSGRHTSRQLGGAGEFVDYREYSAGEDLRRLDWRVLARTGRTYIKLFQDETNLVCTMLVDASRSMLMGSRSSRDTSGSKLEYAQYLTTALSHIITCGRDQVGLATASAGLQDYHAPASTQTHATLLQQAIENIDTEPESRLDEALEELFQRNSRRGVLLLVSDFLLDDLQALFAKVRLFRHRQWEVVCLHLVHPEEERLPEGAAYRFDGLENDGVVACSPAEIRALYQEQFEKHLNAVRTFAVAAGCDYRLVSTAIPYLTTLSGFLVERAG